MISLGASIITSTMRVARAPLKIGAIVNTVVPLTRFLRRRMDAHGDLHSAVCRSSIMKVLTMSVAQTRITIRHGVPIPLFTKGRGTIASTLAQSTQRRSTRSIKMQGRTMKCATGSPGKTVRGPSNLKAYSTPVAPPLTIQHRGAPMIASIKVLGQHAPRFAAGPAERPHRCLRHLHLSLQMRSLALGIQKLTMM